MYVCYCIDKCIEWFQNLYFYLLKYYTKLYRNMYLQVHMYVLKCNDAVLNYSIAIQDIMSRFNVLGVSI